MRRRCFGCCAWGGRRSLPSSIDLSGRRRRRRQRRQQQQEKKLLLSPFLLPPLPCERRTSAPRWQRWRPLAGPSLTWGPRERCGRRAPLILPRRLLPRRLRSLLRCLLLRLSAAAPAARAAAPCSSAACPSRRSVPLSSRRSARREEEEDVSSSNSRETALRRRRCRLREAEPTTATASLPRESSWRDSCVA